MGRGGLLKRLGDGAKLVFFAKLSFFQKKAGGFFSSETGIFLCS